jgi:hypothetical protein
MAAARNWNESTDEMNRRWTGLWSEFKGFGRQEIKQLIDIITRERFARRRTFQRRVLGPSWDEWRALS